MSFDGLRGWLHEASGDVGVVLCGAQGYEDLCSQRGWYLLAQSLSALGYPTLRFDYAGCGDSLGGDSDPKRTEAWLHSVHASVAFLRAQPGVARVVLIGLRMGAMLAARYAQQDHTIAGLALLATPASGRAYAREMKVLSSVVGEPPDGIAPWPAPSSGFLVGGFHFTDETLTALTAFPKPEMLVAALPPMPLLTLTIDGGASPAARGHSHVTAPFEAYPAYMSDSIFSRPPTGAWGKVSQWLAANWPRHAQPRSSEAPRGGGKLAGAVFTETAAAFGRGCALSGILCEPLGPRARRAFIITNTGASYHIGWGRGTVELARLLAARGIATLRIDIAGLGNSPALPGRAPQQVYSMQPIADVRAALDWLEGEGFRDFGVVGTCSGAFLAFHSAVADARLSTVVAVNLNRFVWPQSLAVEDAVRNVYKPSRAYVRKAANPQTLLRLLKGEIDVTGIAGALGRRAVKRLRSLGVRLAGRYLPAKAMGPAAETSGQLRQWFSKLTQRSSRVLFVFSSHDAGLEEIDMYFGSPQGLTAMQGVSFSRITDSDHNFTPQWARAELFTLVAEFAAQSQARA